MTDKQRRFADEYLIDCNATRAYRIAYPRVKSDDVAAKCGSRLLRNADVQTYIQRRMEEISGNRIADAVEVMEYLTSVLRGETKAEIVVVEGCGEGCSSARCVNKAPDEKERLKAAELLGKRFGLFSDKVKVESAIPIVITGGDQLVD